mgnify:FL=1
MTFFNLVSGVKNSEMAAGILLRDTSNWTNRLCSCSDVLRLFQAFYYVMATKVRERHGGSLDKYRDKDIEMMEVLQEFP